MKCSERYCSKDAKMKGKCKKHYQRDYRKENFAKYVFLNLQSNAKRRGKEFLLTFDEFKRFAEETQYFFGKGRNKLSLHIDRIDPLKGYTIDNIRTLTNSENVKRHRSFLTYGYDERGVPCDFSTNFVNTNQPHDGLTPF